ncbi:MAG TPA: DUF1559 domain-containing protein [Thermoguttaceae bacterium]|nr:DUF1559 domain-containing protein [Thermoguttaceae bacterium]
MSIPFICPHCGHQTSVDERYAGQTGPCASCGKTVTVPPVAGAPAAYRPPEKSSAGPIIVILLVVVLAGILVCGGVLAFWGLQPIRAGRTRAQRTQGSNNLKQIGLAMHNCSNNLKQIGLAMHNYHDTYKCFPAAVLTDENGQPMWSWRVAILPFVKQAPLHDQYDFSEPWDGPNNRALHGISIPEYRCPDHTAGRATETSYVMVVGKGTIGGEPNETVKIADIRDGTSNTIMAIEVGTSGIHWMEPRDVTVEEAVTFLTDPAASPFEQVHVGGANVLLADGSVRFVGESTDPETLRALLTRDDGQAVSLDY